MSLKQLIVAVEGTAAVGPYWQTIFSDYLEKIIRCFCGNDPTGQKTSTPRIELSLVMFNTHGSYSACVVQRCGWTRDMDIFFQWLSAIPFGGGGFNDAAIAEGLAEALMMFSPPNGTQNPNMEIQRHCILVAASNPYSLPTPVYRPQPHNPEQSDNIETQPVDRLSTAETLAKSFAQCAVSLSVICPKQLPKLRAIYNAGKRNLRAADPPVDNVKNPHFLVLISENFAEGCAALGRSGMTNIPSNQNPLKMELTSSLPVSGPTPASIPSANGPVLGRQPLPGGNVPPATVKVEPTTMNTATGPAFPHISSVPRAASQAVANLQTSSPISASQEMIPNNESVPEMKPVVNNMAPSLRPIGSAAANVSILNNVAQARQALAGGTSIGLSSMAGSPMLSNMISSGMALSIPPSQTLISSGGPSISAGSMPIQAATGQVTQNSAHASFTSAAPNVSGNSSIGMSQPISTLQGSVITGQTLSGMSQGNLPGTQTAQSKYIKVWEGNLSGQRQGQPVFITRLEGYRNASASETLAANWPPIMQIVRLISQDHMNNKQYVGKADFLVFRAMNQHGFLGQLQEKKLCAVIQLPSQTLLLSVSDKAYRLIGMLFPGDMVVFKPQIPTGQQQQQLQSQQNLQLQHLQLQQQPLHLQQSLMQMQQQPRAQLQQQQHSTVIQMQQQQQNPQQQQQQIQQMQQPQQMMGAGNTNQTYMQNASARSQMLASQGQVSSQGLPSMSGGGSFMS